MKAIVGGITAGQGLDLGRETGGGGKLVGVRLGARACGVLGATNWPRCATWKSGDRHGFIRAA
jgi:hypothetical protein